MRLAAVLRVTLASMTIAACIERPETPSSRATTLDRSSLGDVLLKTAPTPKYPVGTIFDDRIELIGLDVSPDPVKRGEKATVTAYYRALENVGDEWKIFVHIDDDQKSAPRVNADHWPAEERYRTSDWRKGDVVKDTYRFTVSPASSDRLEIWTGLFLENDRMPVTAAGRAQNDGSNRIRAALVPVR